MLINQDFIPAELRTALEEAIASEEEADDVYEEYGDQDSYVELLERQVETGQAWKQIAESLLIQLGTKQYSGYQAWLETLTPQQRWSVSYALDKANTRIKAACENTDPAKADKLWEAVHYWESGLCLSLMSILGILDGLYQMQLPDLTAE